MSDDRKFSPPRSPHEEVLALLRQAEAEARRREEIPRDTDAQETARKRAYDELYSSIDQEDKRLEEIARRRRARKAAIARLEQQERLPRPGSYDPNSN